MSNFFISILTPGFHYLELAKGRINLTLMLGDAAHCYQQLLICGDAKLEMQLRTNHINAWFLDGFAPAKNASMWSQDLFHAIGMLSAPGTTATTFSAASLVKENLQKAGFTVTKVQGYGRKRTMLAAEFSIYKDNRCNRTTPWHVAKVTTTGESKSAIVVGAGLAGCYTAHALAKRGWQVKLICTKRNRLWCFR